MKRLFVVLAIAAFVVTRFNSFVAFLFALPFLIFTIAAFMAARYLSRKTDGKMFWEFTDAGSELGAGIRRAINLQIVYLLCFLFACLIHVMETHSFHYEAGGVQEESGGSAPMHGVTDSVECTDYGLARFLRNGSRAMAVGLLLDSPDGCRIAP